MVGLLNAQVFLHVPCSSPSVHAQAELMQRGELMERGDKRY